MKESLEELQAWAKSVVSEQEDTALRRRIRRMGLDPRLVLRANEMDSPAAFKRIRQEIGAAEGL